MQAPLEFFEVSLSSHVHENERCGADTPQASAAVGSGENQVDGHVNATVSEADSLGSASCQDNEATAQELEVTSSEPEIEALTEVAPRHVERMPEEGLLARFDTQGNAGLDAAALLKIKSFCASILKTLAPPLLKEIETSSRLRAEAEEFTPRRVTRRSTLAVNTTQVKRASAAETTLLKALGVVPEELSVTGEDLVRFKQLFDSPLRAKHLRVLASIFGKILPPSFETVEVGQAVLAN
jgi:hypothetical protein